MDNNKVCVACFITSFSFYLTFSIGYSPLCKSTQKTGHPYSIVNRKKHSSANWMS